MLKINTKHGQWKSNEEKWEGKGVSVKMDILAVTDESSEDDFDCMTELSEITEEAACQGVWYGSWQWRVPLLSGGLGPTALRPETCRVRFTFSALLWQLRPEEAERNKHGETRWKDTIPRLPSFPSRPPILLSFLTAGLFVCVISTSFSPPCEWRSRGKGEEEFREGQWLVWERDEKEQQLTRLKRIDDLFFCCGCS